MSYIPTPVTDALWQKDPEQHEVYAQCREFEKKLYQYENKGILPDDVELGLLLMHKAFWNCLMVPGNVCPAWNRIGQLLEKYVPNAEERLDIVKEPVE